jgi:hypothetical protein
MAVRSLYDIAMDGATAHTFDIDNVGRVTVEIGTELDPYRAHSRTPSALCPAYRVSLDGAPLVTGVDWSVPNDGRSTDSEGAALDLLDFVGSDHDLWALYVYAEDRAQERHAWQYSGNGKAALA